MWSFLVILGLNFEYCGHLSDSQWKHNSIPSLAQSQVLNNIQQNVAYFLKSSPSEIQAPDWHEVIKSKKMDYDGQEVSHAMPIKLEELRPGLPEKGVCASIDADTIVGEHLRPWLYRPHDFLIAEKDYPAKVPRAVVQVESE